MVAGFITGVAWNIWYTHVWAHKSTKNLFFDHFFGYGIFGAAATILFIHPK
jgi:hypothetical protein